MVFSSLFFLCVFLPLNLFLYYISKNRTYRNIVLIISSLVFYAWGEPVWVSLLIFSALFDYFNGLMAEKYRGSWKGKAAVATSVVGNLALLSFFKYSGFLTDNINFLFGSDIHIKQYALPIGISFYTFQTISYVIDVYRGEVEAQKSPYKLLLFVSLFHQLVAGPIVRYKDIANEIDHRKVDGKLFSLGVRRFIIGLGKKVIIANTAGELAAMFLNTDYSRISVLGAWLGILLFAIQIYFDFSGYSDMAIGLGHMFGFHYKENFNYPYISKSATEFWRRWHMSLGSFFRDYIYIPLGGNRRLKIRNLMVVWFLTGLWHGASWNFVLWGVFYFVLIMAEKSFLHKFLEKIPSIFSRIYFIIIMLIGWVVFYHTDLNSAFEYLLAMFGANGNLLIDGIFKTQIKEHILFITLAIVASTPFAKLFYGAIREALRTKLDGYDFADRVIRPLFGMAILILCVLMLVGQSYNPFLYFRF